jgi:hypothetical protein
MKIKNILAIFALLSIKIFAGNVTIITHGFNSTARDTNSWLWNMAFKINDYEKKIFEYDGKKGSTFYLMGFDNGNLKSKLIFGDKPANNNSGDIFILLDWTPYSGDISMFLGDPNHLKSTIDISKSISNFLMTDGSFDGIRGPITQFPMHLIGHSRGGSLVCEIGKRLGEYGIYVHQITTLDPHPLGNDGFSGLVFEGVGEKQDGSAKYGIQKNVVFADNYYQVNGDNLFGTNPEGTIVNGAYNRNVSNEVLNLVTLTTHSHTLVHFWYHTTIYDGGLFTTDGDVSLPLYMRNKWFKGEETNGVVTGYAYSYRAGQRLDYNSLKGYDSDILNNIEYGLGDKYGAARSGIPIRVKGSVANNIIRIDYIGTNAYNLKKYNYGETIYYTRTTKYGLDDLRFKIVYQSDLIDGAQNSQTKLRIFIDNDENIYNDIIDSELVTVPATGNWVVGNASFSISNIVSNLKPGLYRVGAVIGDGNSSRHFYSNNLLYIEPEAKIDFKYISQASSYGFMLYGTIDREYIFQRSYDLKNWEQISTGRFMKFEDGNPSGRDVIYSTGMGPQSYWRLLYK